MSNRIVLGVWHLDCPCASCMDDVASTNRSHNGHKPNDCYYWAHHCRIGSRAASIAVVAGVITGSSCDRPWPNC
jgi:hypothetical protein